MSEYTKDELVKKVNDLDVFNVKLVNHIVNCEFCGNLMLHASLISEDHYKRTDGEENG